LKKRKSRGTGYKYFDAPTSVPMSSDDFIRALQSAKLANDACRYQSLFTREMMRMHTQAFNLIAEKTEISTQDMEKMEMESRPAAMQMARYLAKELWRGSDLHSSTQSCYLDWSQDWTQANLTAYFCLAYDITAEGRAQVVIAEALKP
jgi:hypothetical protein